MAKSFDEKRDRIREVAAGPATPQAQIELKKLLADKSGYLAGEAAEAAKKLEFSALAPDLSAAFFRLLEDGAKVDKGCFGKNRIVEALLSLDAQEEDVYLRGLRHVQMEGAYPKPVDAAPPLRGLCAHALFHMNHPKALLEVAPLLFDPEPVARAEAAAALGESGLDGAAAALHVKVLAGDREPDVMGAAYKSLLRLDPRRYLGVVTAALSSEEEGLMEAAALALGEARPEGAFQALKQASRRGRSWRGMDGLLLGIALLRSDDALAYLADLVESAPEAEAVSALSALALHRHDEALVERLDAIVAARGSRKLAETLFHKFRR
jgi:hypothetical protein